MYQCLQVAWYSKQTGFHNPKEDVPSPWRLAAHQPFACLSPWDMAALAASERPVFLELSSNLSSTSRQSQVPSNPHLNYYYSLEKVRHQRSELISEILSKLVQTVLMHVLIPKNQEKLGLRQNSSDHVIALDDVTIIPGSTQAPGFSTCLQTLRNELRRMMAKNVQGLYYDWSEFTYDFNAALDLLYRHAFRVKQAKGELSANTALVVAHMMKCLLTHALRHFCDICTVQHDDTCEACDVLNEWCIKHGNNAQELGVTYDCIGELLGDKQIV